MQVELKLEVDGEVMNTVLIDTRRIQRQVDKWYNLYALHKRSFKIYYDLPSKIHLIELIEDAPNWKKGEYSNRKRA